MRQMLLVGFLQAQNCSTMPLSWRHPEARTDFMTPEYYQHIGRVLEAGKFQLAFFDDRLSMPDRYGNDHAHAVEHGIRCVKMDPATVLMAMGTVTERLGLGATYSTSYYEPFHVARLFSTLDHMTKGRAAWNVVTSLNDGEALNMGKLNSIPHDMRYDMADEFMEIVQGHWNSWDDDAIVYDRASGRFADPSKVRRLDYAGKFLRSRGPFTVPRSQQGQPVVIQAGQSGRGRQFSARWAELVFMAPGTPEIGRQAYADLKAEVAKVGRNPDEVKVATLVYPIAAASKMEAEDKRALIYDLPNEMDGLSLLSEVLNYDFSTKGLDDTLSDEEMRSISGLQALRDRVKKLSGKNNPTIRDFLVLGGRGRPEPALVGGPKEIADMMEEWFTTGVCDGFVMGATHVPGSYEDIVKYVVPELQRRGLFHKDYEGATLRENLGLQRPVAKHA